MFSKPGHLFWILLFVNLLFFYTTSYAVPALVPDINSVCSVKLINGQIINGYIRIAIGGERNHFASNGFLFLRDGQIVGVSIFNWDYQGDQLNKKKQLIQTFFLLSNMGSSEEREPGENFTGHLDLDKKTLDRTIEFRKSYRIQDYIDVYKKLPKYGVLNSDEKDKGLIERIPVNQIEKFDLIRKPNQNQKKEIEEAEKECGALADDDDYGFNPIMWLKEGSWYPEMPFSMDLYDPNNKIHEGWYRDQQ